MASCIESQQDIPQKYTTMPPRATYYSEKGIYNLYQQYRNNNTDETLVISQPLPNTVKIINEKVPSRKTDSFWWGW